MNTPLDPSEYVVVPHTALLDEFRMSDTAGFVTEITPEYLDRLVLHMNEREAATGDLAPVVIGHTQDGLAETDQPPVVGFARNWTVGPLGQTGRQAAFADLWIRRDQVETARRYPRRSCEVWSSRYEVDPISLLGATTPARDLGLMKLSREGSVTYYPPGDTEMPDEKKEETGAAKKEAGKEDQILSLLTQILEKLSGAPTETAPAAATPEMGDEEYNKLLQELMAGGDQTARTPETEPVAKNSKEDQLAAEVASLRSEVAKNQIRDSLIKLQRTNVDVNPDDEALVSDLAAMPTDMRNRQLDRMKQFHRQAPGAQSFHLETALNGATTGGRKRIASVEERDGLIRLARQKGLTFEAVLASEGYEI